MPAKRTIWSQVLWPLILVSAALLGTALIITAMRVQDQRIRDTASARLDVERVRVTSSIERLSGLPIAVAQQPEVRQLVSEPLNTTLQNRVNLYLQNVAEATGSNLLYVLRKDALAVASSDWQRENPVLGKYYEFRPYFFNAMKNQEARYFAIGVTTGKAGYYIAQPILLDQEIHGVAVVKISLDAIQEEWRNGPDQWLLLDEHGVIILASNESELYQTAREFGPSKRDVFDTQRKYADHPLTEMPGLQNALIDTNSPLEHNGKQYLLSHTPLDALNWRLIHLSNTAPVNRTGLWTFLTVLLTCGFALFSLLYFRERRRKLGLSRIAEEAQRVQSLNDQLNDEIVERKRAETHLREAQSELIQTSKLAALGQMSAAIAHEVNQPLSAIRTYSASTRLLIERDRHAEAIQNLEAIESVTQRMANLTGDLKVFARKSDSLQESVALVSCINSLIDHLVAPLVSSNIRLEYSPPDYEIYVQGNRARIEQVVSNLFRNAVDAIEKQLNGHVIIKLSAANSMATIQVLDNGTGIDASGINHVFEPFFTTKPIGEGLGLGLAIAHGIVEEMGGQLRARNRTNTEGAVFEVLLPQVTDSKDPT